MLPVHIATLSKPRISSEYLLISIPEVCKVCTSMVLWMLEKVAGQSNSQGADMPDTIMTGQSGLFFPVFSGLTL